MMIREAIASDKSEIIDVLQLSQLSTGLPNPESVPFESLEEWLFSRQALTRLVAVEANEIIGHCMVERANPEHESIWRNAVKKHTSLNLFEVGGAFVRPNAMQRGIGAALLTHALKIIDEIPGIPVSATWSVNEHVKRTFIKYGAVTAGESQTKLGSVSLFVF